MKTKKTFKLLLIFILSAVSFLLLTLPFHRIFSLFTLTEVRPAAALYPFLGIRFGWPAAMGIMTANGINDIVNGYSSGVVLSGLALQLLYTMVPYYLWKRLTRGEENIYRLDTVERMLKYVLVCLSSAMLSAVGVGMLIYVDVGINPLKPAIFVLMNNFDISIILGCPLMVLSGKIASAHTGGDSRISDNERIVTITALLQAVIMAVIAVVVYNNGETIGVYDIWNTIYIIELIFINATMLISLLCMMMHSKRRGA